MLESIEKTYRKFEEALIERNELDDYSKFDLDEYKHGIGVLKSYLAGENQEMNEQDARIYSFYLYERHKHFIQIAEEIDAEYNEEV